MEEEYDANICGQISSHEARTLLESVPAPGTNFSYSIFVEIKTNCG